MKGYHRLVSMFRSSPTVRSLTALGAITGLGCSDSSLVCPAVVTYAEPIVRITSVTNHQDNTPIASFTLSDFTLNGHAVDAASLVNGVPNTGAQLSNGTLVCVGSCGFGVSTGTYTFTIVAPPAADSTITVDANYSSLSRNGCSAVASGGTTLAPSL